jgi:hypothetical protein
MRAAQFLAIIGRGSKGSNALENTEDRAGATSEQQDNVINTVNSLDPYGPSWQLVPGNVAAGTVYAQVPTSGTGDLTFTRASTATRTNSAGNIVDVATGVPRIHYRNADGSLSSTGRLLLEPQRTNGIRNSTMVGAVAGSPGTLPTNWERTSGGLTQTIVGIGTENGLQYIDFNFSGTASGTLTLFYETLAQIVASNGQTWSNSFYAKLISGTADSFVLVIRELSSIGGNLGTGTQTFSPSSNLQRFTFTRTNANALTAFIRPGLFVNLTSGAAYDFTIRIAAPQMELGAYATTFIRTSTAAVTRVADAASKTGVSSLIGQTEGTLYADVNINNLPSTFTDLFGFGVFADNVFVRLNSSNQIQAVCTKSSTITTLAQSSTITAGTYKIAFAYKNGDFALKINNAALITSTTTNVLPTSLSVYSLGASIRAAAFEGLVTKAAFFNRRLTNAELAAITTL